ncbi:MAG: HAD family hydrolase [Chthoniobacterales bacterium]
MTDLLLPDQPFAGYIFDCDGTIADTMPLHFQAWDRAMRELGGIFPEDLFYSWGGKPTLQIVGELNAMYNLSLDPEQTVEIKERYYHDLIPQVLPIEPVVRLVKQFHGSAPMAVASGGYREIVIATLRALDLLEFFDVIVGAEDVERGKPHPDPFLEAARRLNVDPTQCLVFEDSPLGMEAAQRAGMLAVLVPSPRQVNPGDQ